MTHSTPFEKEENIKKKKTLNSNCSLPHFPQVIAPWPLEGKETQMLLRCPPYGV